MCFPDENYDYDEMKDSVFLGAYEDEKCVGLAVLQPGFFRYLYLYDLKVCRAYRGQKIGALLMDKAREIALQQGYRGLYTQGQDNNVDACLFYLRYGFHIGGLDTEVYRGTRQEGKADILFYLDACWRKEEEKNENAPKVYAQHSFSIRIECHDPPHLWL